MNAKLYHKISPFYKFKWALSQHPKVFNKRMTDFTLLIPKLITNDSKWEYAKVKSSYYNGKLVVQIYLIF